MANERRFAMAAAVALRGDYDAATLRGLARSAGDPGQVRRLLALAAIYAGSSRSEAAALGGVGLQTVRDWVLRFNGRAGQPAQCRCLVVPAKCNSRRHGKPPLVCHGESYLPPSRESPVSI